MSRCPLSWENGTCRRFHGPGSEGICRMQALHTRGAVSARFDDPNLVSHAGVVPVRRLAQDAGLGERADQLVRLGESRGANAGAKVGSIVAGMVAGADSIDD